MVHFYNGEKVDDYVTLVDSEVTGEVDDTPTEEINVHERVKEKTPYNYKAIVLRTRTLVLLILLVLTIAVIGLIYRSYVQDNEIQSLKNLVSSDTIQEQWLNDSVVCDFEISDTRMIQKGHYDSHIIGGQKGTGCVNVCSHMKTMDPLINGVTVFANATKEGCWCHRNMSAISTRYKSCFLESNYSSITKDIDDAAYTCDFMPMYGLGGAEVKIGNLKGNACINACLYLKQVDNTVNGVSIYQYRPWQNYRREGCWCQKGMRSVHRSVIWSTCWLMPRRKSSVTDNVDHKLCKFSIGYANGGTRFSMGKQNGRDCIQDCLHMKRIDPSINGVTINPKEGQCWCDKLMVNITARFKTCFLNSTSKTTVCDFVSGRGLSLYQRKISNAKGRACIDDCLKRKKTDLSINGVTVYSDSTRGGCFCHRNMTSVDGRYRTCFLKPNTTRALNDFNDTRPTCEFKIGDGDGVTEIFLGKYKETACINACLHLKQIDNTVNGVTIYTNTSRGGCWCEKGMLSRIKRWFSYKYKSCILKYNDTKTEKRESSVMSTCKLSNGYGVGNINTEAYIGKQNRVECIEGCSHMKRVDPSINGITYDISTKACYCKRSMERIGRYKTCFLKS